MGVSAVRAGDYSDCMNADLIIVTADRNRKSCETRLDLISDNIEVMKNVVSKISAYCNMGAILVVANPVDIMTYVYDKLMGLPNGRVFGTGCILITSGLTRCIANYINLNIEVVKYNIVGEYGDSQFLLWSRLTAGGVPMEDYCANVGLA